MSRNGKGTEIAEPVTARSGEPEIPESPASTEVSETPTPPVEADVVSAPEPGDRWVGEGGAVPPEGHAPRPDPDSAEAGLPLIAPDEIDSFLARWSDLQVGFVNDPGAAVRAAESLVSEIVQALTSAATQRMDGIAPNRGSGEPTTEDLRHAIRRYRSLIGVLIPKQTVR